MGFWGTKTGSSIVMSLELYLRREEGMFFRERSYDAGVLWDTGCVGPSPTLNTGHHSPHH